MSGAGYQGRVAGNRGRGRGGGRRGRGIIRGGRHGEHDGASQGSSGTSKPARGGRGGGRFAGQRRGGGRGGGRSARPDHSDIKYVATNVILASITEHFSFYQYSIGAVDTKSNQIDSPGRRLELFNHGLWDNLLSAMPVRQKEDLKRVVFFAGSFCYSSRPIPGLEIAVLPLVIVAGDTTDGDTMTIHAAIHHTVPAELGRPTVNVPESHMSFDLRCSNCTRAFANRDSLLQHCQNSGHAPVYAIEEGGGASTQPPTIEVFVSYASLALQRALGERLARWGKVYVDTSVPIPGVDNRGDDLGVDVFQAYSCNFSVIRPGGKAKSARLALTCDLRAKVIRKNSILDVLYGKRSRDMALSKQEEDRAKREWIGKLVIYTTDRKCYTVVDLVFEHSPATMEVPGRGISHEGYFKDVKKVQLKYPNTRPMIAVLGRKKKPIYLPAELVAGTDFDKRVREQLPKIASFPPDVRTKAIEKIKAFLTPGAQKTKGAGGLLPALGIILENERLRADATVLPIPRMIAGGVEVPKAKADNWAPILSRANFKIDPKTALTLNVVVFYHSKLRQGALQVYDRIRDRVNSFRSFYRFPNRPFAIEEAGDNERHWDRVDRFFSGRMPENVFVLDFVKPRGQLDPAYPVIKRMLAKAGHLSQFVNFNTYAHEEPKDMRRSEIVLQSVARQVLQKLGVRLWWVSVPKSLPLPAIFVGVDVFHAPMVYDPVSKQRIRKASCAAIIVEVVRNSPSDTDHTLVEIYSETFKRSGGNEFQLGDAMQQAIATALNVLDVNPMSAIVWRDGIGDSEFGRAAQEEIAGIRKGLEQGDRLVGEGRPSQTRAVPLSYIVCQKRIATKLLTTDGKYGAPPGTLVKGIQGLMYDTFYINGRAPPFSTPKPVRYIVVEKDEDLKDLALEELTWGQCHNYPNWTGSIKVPSNCQMAHKLAELAGSFADCGESIDSVGFKNKVHFL